MTLINANDLFNITSFQEDTDSLEYPKIYYVCQDGHEIAFSMKHFKKHALSKATNLTAEDAQAMDDFMADKDLGRSNSFLDFYSPNGEEAVRIYFLAWAGDRFTAGHDITFVLKMFKKTQVV